MLRSNAADLRALYLISTGRNPEMYPLSWSSNHERDRFSKVLKPAIEVFSRAAATDEPDGIVFSESDEERKKPDDSKSLGSIASLDSPPPACESEGESTNDNANAALVISEEMRVELQQHREKVDELMHQLESKDSELEAVLKDKAHLIAEIRVSEQSFYKCLVC